MRYQTLHAALEDPRASFLQLQTSPKGNNTDKKKSNSKPHTSGKYKAVYSEDLIPAVSIS